MRASTSITRKSRSQLTLSDFMGVDFTSSPLAVQSNRAADMANFIMENGVNQKRHGWKEMGRITEDSVGQKIRGVFEWKYIFNDSRETGLVVCAGDDVYWCALAAPSINSKLSGGLSLTGTDNVQFFPHNNKLYIVGMGDFLVLAPPVSRFVDPILSSVKDDCYIPTTSISIDNTSVVGSPELLDAVNMLTRKRKNKLIGAVANSTWKLDAIICSGTQVEVCIENTVTASSPIALRAKGTASDQTSNLYLLDSAGEPTVAPVGTITSDDGGVGSITISIITTPFVSNTSNVTVTFTAAALDVSDTVCKCKFGTLFGVNGASDRLFLSGNPERPNVEIWSASGDFTYFSDIDAISVGSDAYAIKGFAHMSDTLAVYKEESLQDASIYYQKGSYVTSYDSEGIVTDVKTEFTLVAGATGDGVISTHACANLLGDNLILTRNGVYGVVIGENISKEERYFRERSRNINAKLKKHADLSKAVAIVYDNRYYLAVNGVCYIADARYKFNSEHDVDNSYNYEWWYWDNIPACTFAVVDDELWFGTSDGRVCKFDNQYTDNTAISIGVGDVTFNAEDGSFTCSNALLRAGVRNGCKISLASTLYEIVLRYIVDLNGDNVGGDNTYYIDPDDDTTIHTDSNIVSSLQNGDKLFAGDVEDTGLIEGVELCVSDINRGRNTFRLAVVNDGEKEYVCLFNEGFSLYRKREGTLYVVDCFENKFFVSLNKSGKPLGIRSHNNEAVEFMGVFYTERNINAQWTTPTLSLGTTEYAKTLEKITVSSEPGAGGVTKVAYQTQNSSGEFIVQASKGFSFERVSFIDFSFSQAFGTSYSTRFNERNFNYIIFRITSDNDQNCAINNMTVTYKLNRPNWGIN